MRVVYGDREVLYLPPLTTVEEVLQSYPHHFVCQPGLNSSGDSSNQMLPLDAELQSDCIYFLLPVPRMFPAAPFTSSQCRCYGETTASESCRALPCKSPLRAYSSPQRIGGLSSPLRGKSLRQMLTGSNCKSKVLPESSLYSAGRDDAPFASSTRPLWRSCPWQPRLGCISEEDDLEIALEELPCHGFLRKRESSVKVPVKPPASPRPSNLKPSKSSRIMADTQTEWSTATAGVPTMVATC